MSSKLQVGSEMTRNCLRKYPSSMEKALPCTTIDASPPQVLSSTLLRYFATSLLLRYRTTTTTQGWLHLRKHVHRCTYCSITSTDLREKASSASPDTSLSPPLLDMSPHSPVHATSPLVSTPRTVQEGPRQRKVLGYHGSVSTTSSGGSSNATGS